MDNSNRSCMSLNEQQQLNFDFSGLSLIEASAGTGKTYTIANLYLRALKDGLTVQQILLVTFTNAATDELRGRIRERLYQALKYLQGIENHPGDLFLEGLLTFEDPQQQELCYQRFLLASRSLDEAAIFTINAFCQRVIQDNALSSGQPFELELVDDKVIYLEVVKDWWRKTIYPLSVGDATTIQQALGSPEKLSYLLTGPLLRDQVELVGEEKAMSLEQWRQQEQVLKSQLLDRDQDWFDELEEQLVSGFAKSKIKLIKDSGNAEQKAQQLTSEFIDSIKRWAEQQDAVLDKRGEVILLGQKIDGSNVPAGVKKIIGEYFSDWIDFLNNSKIYLKIYYLADAWKWVQSEVNRRKNKRSLWSYNDQLKRLDQGLAGHSARQLLEQLRTRYRLAMIDEFQDTDPVQYRIFSRIYQDQKDLGLVMIGDPKQAIYSFRGGDIFTYLLASEQAGRHWTLETNWRSCNELIEPVNQLFTGRKNALVFDQLAYQPVQVAEKSHSTLELNAQKLNGLHLWTHDEKSKEKLIKFVEPAVAGQIVQLLEQGTLQGEPVEAHDIAILVETHDQAEGMKKALRDQGVYAATQGKQTIWETREATDMRTVLQAIAQPADQSLARLAYVCDLFARPMQNIYAEILDPVLWGNWMEKLHHWHDEWNKFGFMRMFQLILDESGLVDEISHAEYPERCLTNLIQLSELLQKASSKHRSMAALIHWLSQQIIEMRQSEQLTRLESDDQLVQIMTLHKSKGLQFPIVFAPYLWKGFSTKDKQVLYHQDRQLKLDFLPDKEAEKQAKQEYLAEQIRLLYVAVTRAETACWLFYAPHQLFNQLPLSWLLQNEKASTGTIFDAQQQWLDNALFSSISPCPKYQVKSTLKLASATKLLVNTLNRTITHDVMVQSFSGMTRQLPRHTSQSSEEDASMEYCMRFPAGARPGTFLHTLLEYVDFNQQDRLKWQQNLEQLCLRLAPRYQLYDIDVQALGDWLQGVLNTPLVPEQFTLARLKSQQRLAELEFDFSTAKVDVHELNLLLADINPGVEAIEMVSFRGRVNGIIDLVCEQNGRYYLADYKSNLLGRKVEDYQPEDMHKAILERRYDLQYLIYSLALHRYLAYRIKDYDYEQHFGGVYYLFLRGMHPQNSKGNGVYYTRLTAAQIDRADQLFAGEGSL
ncbi:MAG: exodeoxyribonuclease V subunit beta [bacterium]